MYMDFAKLNFLLPDQFAANSLADKLESANSKLVNLISGLDNAIELFNPDSDTDSIPSLGDFKNSVLNVVSDSGLESDAVVSSSSGFTTVDDLISQFYDQYCLYWQGSITSLSEANINLVDAAGNQKTDTIYNIMDSLKEGIVSAACQSSALRAMKQGDAASKLAYFNETISNVVDTNSRQYENVMSYYKEQLLTYDSVRDLITGINTSVGADALASEEPITLMDTDVSKFTGASPLSAFSLSTTTNVLAKAGHAVGQAFSMVANAVAGVGKWLFNKGKKYFTETFTNPYDVTDSGDDNEKPCFVGFQYQGTDVVSSAIINSPALAAAIPNDSNILTQINEYLATQIPNQWYKFETYAGELCFKIKSARMKYQGFTVPLIETTRDFVFKPYVINPDTILNNVSGVTIAQQADYLANFTGDLYLDTKVGEIDFIRGLYCGVWQSSAIMSSVYSDLVWQYCKDINVGDNTMSVVDKMYIEDGNTITNKDFLLAACGYHVDGNTTSFSWPLWQINGVGSRIQSSNTFNAIPAAIMLLKVFQKFNPLNIPQDELDALYIPYQVNRSSISRGRFSIKTDAENSDIANKLVTAVIIVAIVVVGFSVARIVTKQIAKKRFWKRMEFTSKCDNAMWQGEKLTAKDKRRYIKYSRKLNASNMLTSGLASGASESLNDASSSMLSAVVSNITGDNVEGTTSNLEQIIKILK